MFTRYKFTVVIKCHLCTLKDFMKPVVICVKCYFLHVSAFSQPSAGKLVMYIVGNY
jgi:hypothetical protein